jgi:hypothetical protein
VNKFDVVSRDLIEVGVVKIYFTGTYNQCINFLKSKKYPQYYDIKSRQTGRLMSWVLK